MGKEMIQVTTDRGRYYYREDDPNQLYWSVSTILSETKPESDLIGLRIWRSSVGDDVADKVMQDGRELGTRFHKLVEDYLNGNLIQVTDSKEYQMLDQYVKGYFSLHNIVTVYNEVMVHNSIDGFNYAGTIDWIGKEDDIMTLADHKSINKISNASRRLSGYAQQLVAYKLAAESSIPDMSIMRGRVNYCSHEGFRSYEVNFKDYEPLFLERLKRFYEDGHDKRILEQIRADKESSEHNEGSEQCNTSTQEHG